MLFVSILAKSCERSLTDIIDYHKMKGLDRMQ